MENSSMEEQLAAYMFVVNPVVCPKCPVRYPRGTKVRSVCGKDIPQKDDWKQCLWASHRKRP